MRRLALAAALALAACDPATTTNADDGSPAAPTSAPPSSLAGFFDCLRENGAAAVSAHRGGPAPGFAENAIPTFENTLRAVPMTFLEVDIARTADGVLVLMHDDRVERTTSGRGAVAELDMAQLLAFSLEDDNGRAVDARVPTLREALNWADGRAVLELDIKRGVEFEDVINEVDAANAMNRVVFITYSVNAAAVLARLAPQAMIYTSISDARELETLQRRNVDLTRIVAWVGGDTPDRALVRALAERGVETRSGIFGEGRDYSTAIRQGVQIVAVDNAREARRDLDAADGADGFAAEQCAAP